MNISEVRKRLFQKNKMPALTGKDYLSTGSTPLNLACTGHPRRGFAIGKYYHLVGDSASGKTWLCLTCLAEAVLNPRFDKHRFIYDNAEDGALMDIRRFFGNKVAERIEPPRKKKGVPIFSTTIEEFYYHVDDAIEQETPFIYILDSMDSLSSKSEADKFKKLKTASRKREQKGETTNEKGSYGDAKAKANSGNIRRLISHLRANGSILIVVSQTRDSFDMFEPKTNAGGRALKFYATLQIWSSIKTKIKKNIRGKDRQLGILAKLTIKKNRITGRERQVTVPIYYSIGFDDVGGCVDYLLEEKFWHKKGSKVVAPEFNFIGKRDKLIQHIEKKGLERKLQSLVAEAWNEIEKACEVQRKKRYV